MITKKLAWAILIVAAAGAVVLLIYPPTMPGNRYPSCFVKKITGLNCPGCGSTRAIYSLLRGQWADAVDYNLLVVILLPALIAGLLSHITGTHNRMWHFFNKPLILLSFILIFTILRNVNSPALNWLHSDK